jgi:hypothetical protein
MKKPVVQITKDDVEKALTNTAWDLGNQVLYDLCFKHPLHKTPQEIIAKIWLIGRSYAAALERRKNKSSDSIGDLFYEDKAAPKIKKSKIDDWFARLKKEPTRTNAIETHAKLTKLFYKITKLEKRSLASKYLHFHFKNLFFIYDSRSVAGIRKVTPRAEKQLPSLSPKEPDKHYANFYRRCLWLQNDLHARLRRKLSPRQIDKVLLYIAGSKKK